MMQPTAAGAIRPIISWLLLVMLVGCGPAVIGAGLAGGNGRTSAAPPLTLAVQQAPGESQAGPCGLIQRISLRVNRPNVTLAYALNGAQPLPFTNPDTGESEPELLAGLDEVRRVLLRAGPNTVVVQASVGAETVQQTLTIELDRDPVVIDLEPPDVQGQDMRLSWSMATGSESFFWIYFDDEFALLDSLSGQATSGSSPIRVPVAELAPVAIGNRTRYTFSLTGLANTPAGLMQHHYFAVRANDGCESRVVAAHTRPATQRLLWPADSRTEQGLVTPTNQVALPPVGGMASSVDVVGMPPLFVDRGFDATGTPFVAPADGHEDMVVVDQTGLVFVSRNDLSGLQPPVIVDDTESTAPVCPSVPPGATGEQIRNFSFDNDGDQRPDLFLLTAERLWVYFGDDVEESLTPYPTPAISRFLNWKKSCNSLLSLSDLSGVPAGSQFVDAWHGDFDGDGAQDLAVSVGEPQTSMANGRTHRIYVFYQSRDPNGFANWDWPANVPTEIEVGTDYGDDAYFVVGDVDRDGRDDLLTLRHLADDDARFRIWLMRGRSTSPLLVQSGSINPRDQTARWDQTALRDLDHDGALDVLSLQSFVTGAGPRVRLVGYRTNLDSSVLETNTPFLSSELGRTHLTSLPNPTRQRGHLIVQDIDGNGVEEVLLRSIVSGVEYSVSRVSVYGGLRDAATGRQNWQFLSSVQAQVDFLLPLTDEPHVHFASVDLNLDGVDDFAAVHAKLVPPHEVVTMQSSASWDYERFVMPPTPSRYRLAGTLATAGGAAAAAAGQVDREGDVVLAVDGAAGVSVLPASSDNGVRNGAFAPVRRVVLEAPLPAAVQEFAVPSVPAVTSDVQVLLVDGTIGTLELGAGGYVFRNEASVVGAVSLHAAWLDGDLRADAVVIDSSQMLHLLGTVDGTGARNQDLAVRASLQLPRQPEVVLVTSTEDDGYSEIVVALEPVAGSEERTVLTYRTLRDDDVGTVRFANTTLSTNFPVRLVSLAAGNFSGRYKNDLQKRKWLVGGTADGRILTARPNDPIAGALPPGLAPVGNGEIEVLVADMTNDNLPDIVAYERGSQQLFVIRTQPEASDLFRFPNPGAYEYQGAGFFDNPVVVPIPEPLASMASGLVNDDPYQDLMLVSADGQRLHLMITVGAQQPR